VTDVEFERWFLLFYTLFAIVAIAALMWVGGQNERVERRRAFSSVAKRRLEHDR
jgi:hypothetical protein